jgi:ribonuclease HI
MYFDGSLTKKGVGGGVVFVSPLGEQLQYAIRIHFLTSNNVAKYEALMNGLCIVVDLGTTALCTIFGGHCYFRRPGVGRRK